MKSCTVDQIFDRVAVADPPGSGEWAGVAVEAAPFVAALVARTSGCRVWAVCPGVREQEDFAGELSEWLPGTAALPELPAIDPGVEILPDPEQVAARLELLAKLSDPAFLGPVVVFSSQLAEEVEDPSAVADARITLREGQECEPAEVVAKLVQGGYERVAQAAVRGEFAQRGGILDVFSRHASMPSRIEWFDREIESVRTYDPDTQSTTAAAGSCEVLLARKSGSHRVALSGLIRPADLTISVGDDCHEPAGLRLIEGAGEPGREFFPLPFGEFAAGDLVLDEMRGQRFHDQLAKWRDDGWMVVLAAATDGEAERFQELAAESGRDASWVHWVPRAPARGFVHPASRTAVISAAGLFGRAAVLRARRAALRGHRAASRRAGMDFSEFAGGDFVVHLEHGIGKFAGLVADPDGSGEEVLAIEYAGQARLYVPVSQAWQVSRYAGLGRARPDLSELGSDRWAKAKQKAVASVFDYASRMLRVQAERETLEGFACPPDSHWQAEFENAFPFRPTADQSRAVAETKRDMESTRPMDRLVCGDVGFGKTEVAIRAIFKAAVAGRQAVFLAPTTVLAHQHFQTLRERFSDYPVTIELLDRHRPPAVRRKILSGLADGSLDVVVGTHRIVSPDVHFKSVGLVVVDEEQRFGVRHKEMLKERFRQVDVLTLSATPIPRTLYMALVGARDMSLIETPPPNRQPVETLVCAYDERVWRDAINREIARGGQVYFLHNRVATIEKVAARIADLCSGARVAVGHGQMADGELDAIMERFVAGKADVLVATTIIESGLDIPNANTIIIDRADRFGLADLYQLRGRVGRAGAKAYAYLMLPRDLMGAARRRVSAIRQYSELGSGFKIAMRDLELRGAGNLLGTAQSGHILAVGFDLYCKMLRRAVDSLGGKKRFSRLECPVHVDFAVVSEGAWTTGNGEGAPAFVPSAYVADARLRVACYRQLAECEDAAGLEVVRADWRDRFGPLPEAAGNALVLAAIGLAGAGRRLSGIEVRDGRVMMARKGGFVQEGGRFPRLTESDPASRLREILTFVEEVPDQK